LHDAGGEEEEDVGGFAELLCSRGRMKHIERVALGRRRQQGKGGPTDEEDWEEGDDVVLPRRDRVPLERARLVADGVVQEDPPRDSLLKPTPLPLPDLPIPPIDLPVGRYPLSLLPPPTPTTRRLLHPLKLLTVIEVVGEVVGVVEVLLLG
jgi:hypothetical protein